MKYDRAAAGIHRHPHPAHSVGDINGVINFRVRAVGNGAGPFLGRRIDHVELATGTTGDECTANVDLAR